MFEREYCDPYVIAEIGVNHEGSMARAKSMIEAVARAGGHAAKFQTYKADTLASATRSPAYWDTSKEAATSQHALFSRFDSFGESDYRELATHCEAVGVDFLSTPFDLASVDYLAPIMPAIKIASADLTNVPLLRKAARAGKPVILSTGAATHDEVDWALGILEGAGAVEIALLHCVLRYPTPPAHANLRGIEELRKRFGHRAVIGYSDHVAPSAHGDALTLEMGAVMGARVLEKHFTDDRTATGNDHYHAVDEAGLRSFMDRVVAYKEFAGTGTPDIDAQQAAVTNARRRIFVSRDVAAGRPLTEDDLIALRADIGIPVAQWDALVGLPAARDLVAGAPLVLDDLEQKS